MNGALPPPRYPGYDVLAKWDSPSFDDITRNVLAHRLDAVPPRRWLTAAEWGLLDAINARLLPQPERAQPIPITPWIDAMLHDDRGEGFRHPDMLPPPRTPCCRCWPTAAPRRPAGRASTRAASSSTTS
jgi:hypothetical protein